jgi:hypothetical protein
LEGQLSASGADSKEARWIRGMAAVLRENLFAGDQIQKSRIPRQYRSAYDVANLYRYRHPEGYRSCYTVIHREALVIDLMTHKQYEKRFGYS